MTAANLAELVEKMKSLETDTTLTVDGNTYTFQDVCGASGESYKLPCLRLSAVDAYSEGGYMWQKDAKAESQIRKVFTYVIHIITLAIDPKHRSSNKYNINNSLKTNITLRTMWTSNL